MPKISNVRSWSPRNGLQIVSLQILPAPRPRELRSVLDPYFTKYTVITLCRGLPALFGEERTPFGTSVKDEVATEAAGSIAIASYRYSRFGPPDPAGEAALRSLCPSRA